MTTYAIAQLKSVRMGPELRSYVEAIDGTLAPYGGNFIIHGGAQTPLEGELGGDLIVIAFPDRTSAEDWYRSPAYQRILPLRRGNSDGAVILIDGVGPEHRATDIFHDAPGGNPTAQASATLQHDPLFVRDWGAGNPVVFLAGWGMNSTCWGETMAPLNRLGLRTVAYDRRGHGRSPDPGSVSIDALADDLAGVLSDRDLAGVILVAHSGAVLEAIRYLSRHGTDRVSSLVIVGGTGPCMTLSEGNPDGFPQEAVEAQLAQISGELGAWIDENAKAFAPMASDRIVDWIGSGILECSRRILVDFQRLIAESDIREEARALTLPVKLIHGDLDASAPLALTARRYSQLIEGSELEIYEGVAHGVMITHPARLAADIAAWRARLDRSEAHETC